MQEDTVIYRQRVEFGDCDPAGIVWFPNFFRWIDAASRNFFASRGVPRWDELARTHGIIGTPLVDTQVRFVNSASYGDELAIAVRISEWRRKSFVQNYRVTRGDTLILECQEVRVFASHKADDVRSIKAMPVPEDVRALCGGGGGEAAAKPSLKAPLLADEPRTESLTHRRT